MIYAQFFSLVVVPFVLYTQASDVQSSTAGGPFVSFCSAKRHRISPCVTDPASENSASQGEPTEYQVEVVCTIVRYRYILVRPLLIINFRTSKYICSVGKKLKYACVIMFFWVAYFKHTIKATMSCLFAFFFSKISMLNHATQNSLFNHAYLLICMKYQLASNSGPRHYYKPPSA